MCLSHLNNLVCLWILYVWQYEEMCFHIIQITALYSMVSQFQMYHWNKIEQTLTCAYILFSLLMYKFTPFAVIVNKNFFIQIVLFNGRKAFAVIIGSCRIILFSTPFVYPHKPHLPSQPPFPSPSIISPSPFFHLMRIVPQIFMGCICIHHIINIHSDL
jgi:hypothetical protein